MRASWSGSSSKNASSWPTSEGTPTASTATTTTSAARPIRATAVPRRSPRRTMAVTGMSSPIAK
jgi:hypothetical protein